MQEKSWMTLEFLAWETGEAMVTIMGIETVV